MVELAFSVEAEDIQVIEDALSEDQAKERAEKNKHKIFGVFASLRNKFDKNNGGIVMSHIEKRYDPFWHITGELYLEYRRMTEYVINVAPEVQSLRISGMKTKVRPGTEHVTIMGEDFCVERGYKEILVDATSAKPLDLCHYLNYKTRKLTETEELMNEHSVVIPAKIKASFLIRDIIKELIKPFHADKIIKETVEIKKLTLYFKPMWALEFKESATGKTRVLEVDAVTGAVHTGNVFKREFAEIFSENELFKIGKDVALALVPGGEAASVLVTRLVEKRRNGKNQTAQATRRRAPRSKKGKTPVSTNGLKKPKQKVAVA